MYWVNTGLWYALLKYLLYVVTTGDGIEEKSTHRNESRDKFFLTCLAYSLY